jgi:hypothetical protein
LNLIRCQSGYARQKPSNATSAAAPAPRATPVLSVVLKNGDIGRDADGERDRGGYDETRADPEEIGIVLAIKGEAVDRGRCHQQDDGQRDGA